MGFPCSTLYKCDLGPFDGNKTMDLNEAFSDLYRILRISYTKVCELQTIIYPETCGLFGSKATAEVSMYLHTPVNTPMKFTRSHTCTHTDTYRDTQAHIYTGTHTETYKYTDRQ